MDKLIPEFAKQRLDPAARYGLRLTLLLIAVSLIAVPFSFLVLEVTRHGDLVEFDKALADNLIEIRQATPQITPVLNFVSALGAPVWFWVLIGGVCVYLWRHERPRLVAFLLTSTLGGSVVNTIVKETIDRPRPSFRDPAVIIFQEGKSFPSGHTMSSTIAYGALLLIFLPLIPQRRRPWAIAGVVTLVLAIGLSRLGLGVHYVSDVVGGLILGIAWLTASTAAFSLWRVDRGRPPVEPASGVEPEAKSDLEPSSR